MLKSVKTHLTGEKHSWKYEMKGRANTFSCQSNNASLRGQCYFNDLKRGQITCKKRREIAVKTVRDRAYQQQLICFPLTRWKRNQKSMCLLEQTELAGCVLNGWAPREVNYDSQLPLTGCGSTAQEKFEWENLLSKQWTTAVSSVRLKRLSSVVYIVFEQLALICHLVEWAFVAHEGKHCVIINGESS